MMRKLLIVYFFAFASALYSQIENETRAVWLATNFRLDWPPPTFNSEQQKSEIKKILDNLQLKNFNTIYFQVFFNGTTLYKSRTEPMSYFITGVLDDSSAYDPLQFAIDECHVRGIEIHAWINTLRCFTGTENFIKEHPKHIIKRHPEWVKEKFIDGQKTYWLDAGLPEVQKYIVNLSSEIINNYDIDGLQLDFLRYPSADFDDTESYKLYSNGKSLGDWRRENITQIVSGIRKKINSSKRKIKFGITPIGIYKNIPDGKGLQGYADVFQDTFDWLDKKLLDYAVPQIYWNFKNNPKFDVVAKNWVNNSNGRNIVLGIAAYKNDVYDEMNEMINFSRKIGAAGVAFFRYENIKNYNFDLFAYKSFPAKMEWLDNEPPDEIDNIDLTINEEKNSFQISWQKNTSFEKANEIMYYALFKLSNESEKLSMKNLFHLIPATKNQTEFVIKNPSQFSYLFAVKTIDRFWNLSLARSNIVKAEIPALKNYLNHFLSGNKPILIKDSDNNFILSFYSLNEDLLKVEVDSEIVFDSIKIKPGLNLIKQNFDLQNKNMMKISFINSRKEHSLRLQRLSQK